MVVGSSNTGLATLETLLLQPNLNYTSLTLLSRNGLQSDSHVGTGCAYPLLPWKSHLDGKHLDRLAMHARVRIVAQELVDWDKESKVIK